MTRASSTFMKAGSDSVWAEVDKAPADPIFGLTQRFKQDPAPKKVLLGQGVYRDDNGQPFVLDCVFFAEAKLLARENEHEYAPMDGLAEFRKKAVALAFGADSDAVKSDRVASCQSVSGTGALMLAFEFLKEWYPNKNAQVFLPDPTWPIHPGLAEKSGFKVAKYRYYDDKSKGFNLKGMLEDLENADEGQIVVLHVCAHNPTGCDPTEDDWKQILEVMLKRKHFAVFDSAYQGFATGDLDKDIYSMRLFADATDRLMLCQSFAKNFGLYGERAGCLSVLAADADEAARVQSRVKMIARYTYSNPPIHGAKIVDRILSNKQLTQRWHEELEKMSSRIKDMREGLVDRLGKLGSEHDWSHITRQIGMFAYTGLSAEQVEELITEHHIYMTADGRMSISGLNTSNIDYVAECIHKVTSKEK